MRHYLDTSLLVAALTPEARTDGVHAWLHEHRDGELGLSDWTVTEFASALSLKVRAGHLSEDQRRDVDEVFGAWLEESLVQVAVLRRDFAEAARLLGRHETGLRAGDALHLATSSQNGAQLVTLDQRMVEGGKALGCDALLL